MITISKPFVLEMESTMTDIISIPEDYWPKIDALPGDLARIAEIIEEHRPGLGVDLTLFLAQAFRGQHIYLRNVDFLLRQIRNDSIRREYDHCAKVRDLALKWKLSTRWVEDILNRPEKSTDKQLSLFS